MFRCCTFVHVVTRFVLMCHVSLALVEVPSFGWMDGRFVCFPVLSHVHSFVTCDGFSCRSCFVRAMRRDFMAWCFVVLFPISRVERSVPSCRVRRIQVGRVHTSTFLPSRSVFSAPTCSKIHACHDMDDGWVWILDSFLPPCMRQQSWIFVPTSPFVSLHHSLCDSSIHVWFDSCCFCCFCFAYDDRCSLGVDR